MPNFTIVEHTDALSQRQGAPWYVTSTTPDPDGDTTWGHFPTREEAEAFITSVNNKELNMSTIYIPRTDYVQRADDEGHDYVAYRTIYAAAGKWVGTGRQWEVGPGDEVLAFAERIGDDVHLSVVGPDDNIEGLYPADSLPFTIHPYLAEPGEWVNVIGVDRDPRRVLDVLPDGTVEIDINGSTGAIAPGDKSWHVVPTPRRTFTVTVRGDLDDGDVLDALLTIDTAATVASA